MSKSKDWSLLTPHHRERSSQGVSLFGIAIALTGCGSGTATTSLPSVAAPLILSQPADKSVPMGLIAVYSVTADGSSLRYQWARNNVPIADANGASYSTPATDFADNGAVFSVTVSNSAGQVTSQSALLTVTARAPITGDLRFQQVDAPSTLNGWGNDGVGLSTNLLGRTAESYSGTLGTSFYVGPGDCGATPVLDGTGCTWSFSVVPFKASNSSQSLTAGYASDSYDNFEADLESSVWPPFNNGLSPSSSTSVITSVDFEPSNALFALSWIQSATTQGFTLFKKSVDVAGLQAEATLEGANSRVITALSNNSGLITYFAYSWNADATTIYQVQVSTATPSTASAAAANLAAQGYIITATGKANDAGDVLFVGTKVQGDTMPRDFVVAQGSSELSSLQQGGYANVGVTVDSGQPNPYTYIGER